MFPGVLKQSFLRQHHSNLENLKLKACWSDVDEEKSVLVPSETCFLRESQEILVSGGTPGNLEVLPGVPPEPRIHCSQKGFSEFHSEDFTPKLPKCRSLFQMVL